MQEGSQFKIIEKFKVSKFAVDEHGNQAAEPYEVINRERMVEVSELQAQELKAQLTAATQDAAAEQSGETIESAGTLELGEAS